MALEPPPARGVLYERSSGHSFLIIPELSGKMDSRVRRVKGHGGQPRRRESIALREGLPGSHRCDDLSAESIGMKGRA